MPTVETLVDRLGRLIAYVEDLTLEALDELAELGTGHTSQIMRGRTAMPREATLRKLSTTLGTNPAWLAYGAGDEPSADKVRRSVRTARKGVGGSGRHPTKVRAGGHARKGQRPPRGSASDRSIRAGAASR